MCPSEIKWTFPSDEQRSEDCACSDSQLRPAVSLTAWLHITGACNLRCLHCYLDKTNEVMSETVGRAAVEAVFRSAVRHGFKTIKLKYAGGEPTLNFGLVRILHERARALAAALGLELREVVLSNGIALDDAMLDFIRGAGMRLMVSLDGVGAIHDAQRPPGRRARQL